MPSTGNLHTATRALRSFIEPHRCLWQSSSTSIPPASLLSSSRAAPCLWKRRPALVAYRSELQQPHHHQQRQRRAFTSSAHAATSAESPGSGSSNGYVSSDSPGDSPGTASRKLHLGNEFSTHYAASSADEAQQELNSHLGLSRSAGSGSPGAAPARDPHDGVPVQDMNFPTFRPFVPSSASASASSSSSGGGVGVDGGENRDGLGDGATNAGLPAATATATTTTTSASTLADLSSYTRDLYGSKSNYLPNALSGPGSMTPGPSLAEMTAGAHDAAALEQPRLDRFVGRTVAVERARDLSASLEQLDRILARNGVRRSFQRQRFHERPGLRRKRLKSERWRRRFRAGFRAMCDQVSLMRLQGW